jgi:hypothetical protein
MAFFSSLYASIFSWTASRHAIICSTFIVWCHNDQDPMQFPVQPLLTPVSHLYIWLSTGFWIGYWIYWLL